MAFSAAMNVGSQRDFIEQRADRAIELLAGLRIAGIRDADRIITVDLAARRCSARRAARRTARACWRRSADR